MKPATFFVRTRPGLSGRSQGTELGLEGDAENVAKNAAVHVLFHFWHPLHLEVVWGNPSRLLKLGVIGLNVDGVLWTVEF